MTTFGFIYGIRYKHDGVIYYDARARCATYTKKRWDRVRAERQGAFA